MADDKHDEVADNPDPHFEPVVSLPAVEIKTLEEEEEELLKLRAKLFRYDSASDPPEWKERGVGDVKILKHKAASTCRILMRRDKTLKVCANHAVQPHMELKPNCGSEKAWVWSTPADFADEESKAELLAIRFANAENAQKFKGIFEEAKKMAANNGIATIGHTNKDEAKNDDEESTENDKEDADDVADKLKDMTVKETKDKGTTADSNSSKGSGDKASPDNSEKDQAER